MFCSFAYNCLCCYILKQGFKGFKNQLSPLFIILEAQAQPYISCLHLPSGPRLRKHLDKEYITAPFQLANYGASLVSLLLPFQGLIKLFCAKSIEIFLLFLNLQEVALVQSRELRLLSQSET